VGQILGYLGWARQKLCRAGQNVRGILIVNEVTDSLRLAVSAVPGLEIYRFEITFQLVPDRPSTG
jgi:restriction system protein